jgi:hypothetical protein
MAQVFVVVQTDQLVTRSDQFLAQAHHVANALVDPVPGPELQQ